MTVGGCRLACLLITASSSSEHHHPLSRQPPQHPLLLATTTTTTALTLTLTLLMVATLLPHTVEARGQWSQWTEWSQCTLTCDGGERSRSRRCDSLRPGLAAQCVGTTAEAEVCNIQPCTTTVNGHWSPWGTWSSCSVGCGFGTRMRERVCDNPPPSPEGVTCQGVHNETANCHLPCPIDGQWTSWTSWSQCSVSCGLGFISRERSCTNPPPHYGGLPCPGLTIEMIDCVPFMCPVDGHWTEWTTWSQCSDTCSEEGSRTRWRFCANPAPAFGGRDCSGDSVGVASCRQGDCRVDGGWAAWSEWQACSQTCGIGEMARHRLCNNPATAFGGLNCSGDSLETFWCQLKICPVDCAWYDWTQWDDCSVSCGNGTQQRRRRARTFAQHGGQPCQGPATEEKPCDNQPLCPVHGQWSSWTNWTECSATCEGGIHERSRECNNPAPQHKGQPCLGRDHQDRACNIHACPLPRERTYVTPAPTEARKATGIGVTGLVIMLLLFIALVAFDIITLQRKREYRKVNRSAFPKKVSLRQQISHIRSAASIHSASSASATAAAAAMTMPRQRHNRIVVTSRTNGDVRLTVHAAPPPPAPPPLLIDVTTPDTDSDVIMMSPAAAETETYDNDDVTMLTAASPAVSGLELNTIRDGGFTQPLLGNEPKPTAVNHSRTGGGSWEGTATGAAASEDDVMDELLSELNQRIHELDDLANDNSSSGR